MVRVAASCLFAATLWAQGAEGVIRAEMTRQQEAWNRGDVRAFMESYEKSPGTLFVGSSVTRGWDQVLANYVKRYPTRDNMGRVTFSDVEVTMLGASHALVFGRFRLERSQEAGGNTGGLFTLVWRKTKAGWKIIADHTSAGS
jgi:ketosteroid isomerase-like protein